MNSAEIIDFFFNFIFFFVTFMLKKNEKVLLTFFVDIRSVVAGYLMTEGSSLVWTSRTG